VRISKTKFAMGVGLFIVAALALVRSIVVYLDDGYKRRERFTFSSPDNSYAVSIESRAAFPALEIFDPSTIVFVRLVRTTDGSIIDERIVELTEDSDLRKPNIDWGDSRRIVISELDSEKRGNVELQVPIN